jgi:thiosulfate/3-mercaptopyruvate sulfurtransferase
MSLVLPDIVVSAEWLKQHIYHPDLVVLDASSHMLGSPRDGYEEWQKERIAGALFFDINRKICDPESSLPHMLPSAELFAREAQALGIHQNSIVVVYDSLGIFSAPRAWWMFAAMGHTQCAVLDGGLPEWHKQGGDIEHGLPKSTLLSGDFKAHFKPDYVKNQNDMEAAINAEHIVILDARSSERFNAQVSEPRPELRRGHIPNSKNLPFNDLLDNGKLKDRQALQAIFDKYITSSDALYATCGSGVTACIIVFVAQWLGFSAVAVYDGSWCEWGNPDRNLPIS